MTLERLRGSADRCEVSGGFTLIELLVVVAIISVLLAVLLPGVHRARILAKRIACQGRLKQIAYAWNVYLSDSEGRFYQGLTANLDYGGWQGLRTQGEDPFPRPLNPYVGLSPILATEEEARVFCCPADRGGVPGYAVQTKVYSFLGTSYQTNILLIGQNQILVLDDAFQTLHEEINTRLPHIELSRVHAPSRLLLIGDYGWINQWKPIPHPREDWKELAEWHQRTDCHDMAFLDGHVGFIRIEKGLYVGDDYTVLPFKELYGMAREAQAAFN
jgi:prepilin-type N-terminal cleavage/methylation domain-containing protein